jgi:hypothetical protein
VARCKVEIFVEESPSGSVIVPILRPLKTRHAMADSSAMLGMDSIAYIQDFDARPNMTTTVFKPSVALEGPVLAQSDKTRSSSYHDEPIVQLPTVQKTSRKARETIPSKEGLHNCAERIISN